MVIIDTNAIIDHLRQQGNGETRLMRLAASTPTEELAISILTIQELYEGQSTKNPAKEQELLMVLAPLQILPYTYTIAALAGRLARDARQPLEFADAAIAATAMDSGAHLCTLNERDFRHIPRLSLWQNKP